MFKRKAISSTSLPIQSTRAIDRTLWCKKWSTIGISSRTKALVTMTPTPPSKTLTSHIIHHLCLKTPLSKTLLTAYLSNSQYGTRTNCLRTQMTSCLMTAHPTTLRTPSLDLMQSGLPLKRLFTALTPPKYHLVRLLGSLTMMKKRKWQSWPLAKNL